MIVYLQASIVLLWLWYLNTQACPTPLPFLWLQHCRNSIFPLLQWSFAVIFQMLDCLTFWTKTLWIQCFLLCGKKIPYKEGIEVWTLICCNPSYLYACKRSWEGVNPVVECPSSGIVHVDIVGSVVDVCFLKHLPAAASGHSQSGEDRNDTKEEFGTKM